VFFYSSGFLYIFYTHYNDVEKKFSLSYYSISSSGELFDKHKTLINITTDNSENIDCEVLQSPDKTKFLVKLVSPIGGNKFLTEFGFYKFQSMEELFHKKIEKDLALRYYQKASVTTQVLVKNRDFHSIQFDDNGDIVYSYSTKINLQDQNSGYKLFLEYLRKDSKTAESIVLDIDELFRVEDLKISFDAPNTIAIGGFYKQKKAIKGIDNLPVGFFSFLITRDKFVVQKSVAKLFDDKLLESLEVNDRKSHYLRYKMDYAYFINQEFYFVGQQFVRGINNNGSISYTGNPDAIFYGGTNDLTPLYQYTDVIISKLNHSGELEWMKNIPVRIRFEQKDPHVSMQYISISTKKSICILNNDSESNLKLINQPNLDLRGLRYLKKMRGSILVCHDVALADGTISHKSIYKNEVFVFDPIPSYSDYTGTFPSYSERKHYYPNYNYPMSINGGANGLILQTENKKNKKFLKLKFD
jgi:hypothetical protein